VVGSVPLTLPRSYVDEIVAHAQEENPNECCGVIAGDNGVAMRLFKAVNAEHSPYRYNIDSRELLKIYREIDDNGWEMMVIYHSHTHTPAYPSPTDLSLAGYPDAYYLLVSLTWDPPDIRAYRIIDGAVSQETLFVE
jgi:[CysO sulfur-carrier protein]-S-L-cysteine hydrolase